MGEETMQPCPAYGTLCQYVGLVDELAEALEELVGEELCGDRNPDNARRETEYYRPVISWAMRHRARKALAKARGQ